MGLFERLYGRGRMSRARALGSSCEYAHAASGTTETVTLVIEEYWGAIDEIRRGTAYGAVDDFAEAPERGDTVTYDGRSWIVTNVIDPEDGEYGLVLQAGLEVS